MPPDHPFIKSNSIIFTELVSGINISCAILLHTILPITSDTNVSLRGYFSLTIEHRLFLQRRDDNSEIYCYYARCDVRQENNSDHFHIPITMIEDIISR